MTKGEGRKSEPSRLVLRHPAHASIFPFHTLPFTIHPDSMRIFHIVATDQGWGGLERSVVELANMQARNHEVFVAAAPVVLERLDASVKRIPLPVHLSRRHPLLLWRLLREIVRSRPAVLHAHANKAAALVNAIRFVLPRALARVATVQNTKRSTRVFAPFDRVIAVSRMAGESLGLIPHEVIWNAIPRPTASATSPAVEGVPFLGQGKPVLAAIGRLVPAKGFDLLLDALVKVDAFLWIVGDGPLRAELEARAKTAGVADRVWFAGFRRDAETLMRRADLMVISSRHEGFPFAFVEMLLLRRPVVGTRVAGVEEVLPETLSCPTEDADALAALINDALRDLPSLPARFEPVFAFAAERLTLENTIGKIEAVYAELLAGRGTVLKK